MRQHKKVRIFHLMIALTLMVSFFILPAAADDEERLPLRITEVMAANKHTLKDSFGQSPDWIEIFNTSDEPVSLEGYALTDKKSKPDKFVFPADAVIGPGGFLIVFASGLARGFDDEYHAPFKLSKSGESVYLFYRGKVADSVFFGPQLTDVSLALDEEGIFRQTLMPTPGAVNIIVPVD